ncbi:ATP-binding protein [uncultured Alistipes sp.]|uniref:sensor histidine kinase n=1 Tax=uncultured Alistipes sp. TaxID=538949 RepID=UPI0026397117|nr:ATP-binding protein [uncultured Alistipes sp.]
MKITYKQKLTLSFVLIFTVFTVGIILFEQYRARGYKTEALEEKLEAYSDLAYSYISGVQGPDVSKIDSLLALFPSNLRLTCVSPDGSVRYDNLFADPGQLENHAQRPEVVAARSVGRGYDIRTSASNSNPYLYFAKYYGDMVVRAALPYDIEVQHLLEPDNVFLYFIVVMFVAGILLIRYVGGHFGGSIRRLRDFSEAIARNEDEMTIPQFPQDELGEIGRRISKGYKRLKESESRFSVEREKLLQHVQISAEGICFFKSDRSVAFYNGLFLRYLNAIVSNPDMNDILSADAFAQVREFILSDSGENYYEYTIKKSKREFLLRLNRFEDNSFEVVLNDVSEQEKTRRLKREMTGNIAHELRTPVTSIRGFLETILEMPLSEQQQRKFIEKAYNQTLVLSELIRDMGLLTKIEENPDNYDFHPVDLHLLLDKVEEELKPDLAHNQMSFHNRLPEPTIVRGNEGLLHSVFRNLTDNAVKYAGQNTEINITRIGQEGNMLEISFADTGKGIADEAHLSRIFERFYRVDEGRTRDAGGSGLGLSIVRNAVLIHGGMIRARNRAEGGLEFILRLPVM